MKSVTHAPPLTLTCDALESVLSDTNPLTSMLAMPRARPFLIDLVRGIRELAEHQARAEDAISYLAVAVLRLSSSKDLHDVDELRELAGGDFEAFAALVRERRAR